MDKDCSMLEEMGNLGLEKILIGNLKGRQLGGLSVDERTY
jgi:hypothetical protein